MSDVLTWALREEITELAKALYEATHDTPGSAHDWVPYLYEKRPKFMSKYPPISDWGNDYAEKAVPEAVKEGPGPVIVKEPVKLAPKKQVHRVKKDSSLLKSKSSPKKVALPKVKKAVVKAVAKAKKK